LYAVLFQFNILRSPQYPNPNKSAKYIALLATRELFNHMDLPLLFRKRKLK